MQDKIGLRRAFYVCDKGCRGDFGVEVHRNHSGWVGGVLKIFWQRTLCYHITTRGLFVEVALINSATLQNVHLVAAQRWLPECPESALLRRCWTWRTALLGCPCPRR